MRISQGPKRSNNDLRTNRKHFIMMESGKFWKVGWNAENQCESCAVVFIRSCHKLPLNCHVIFCRLLSWPLPMSLVCLNCAVYGLKSRRWSNLKTKHNNAIFLATDNFYPTTQTFIHVGKTFSI